MFFVLQELSQLCFTNFSLGTHRPVGDNLKNDLNKLPEPAR